MKNFILVIIFVFFMSSFAYSGATSPGHYYVTSTTLNVRLAPNSNGKLTNKLDKGEKIEVFEIQEGWARISQYYSGVLEGIDGNVARWVYAKYLSTNRPAVEKSGAQNSPLEKALKPSDDYSKYKNVFMSASQKLINNGICDIADFKQMGGWVRSINHKPKPVYFTYCGGMTKSNRIYLNAATGETSR